MRNIILKETNDGVKFRIVETSRYLEYTADKELILGFNKENKTLFSEGNHFDTTELEGKSVEELKEIMLKNYEEHKEALTKLARPTANKKNKVQREINVIAWVDFLNLALVKIKMGEKIEYAVVRGLSENHTCWDYSLGYFSDFEKAKELFMNKMEEK